MKQHGISTSATDFTIIYRGLSASNNVNNKQVETIFIRDSYNFPNSTDH